MNIRDLVEYKQKLDTVSMPHITETCIQSLNGVMQVIQSTKVDYKLHHYEALRDQARNILTDFGQNLADLKDKVLTTIDREDWIMYERSRQLYQEGRRDSAEHIFIRQAQNKIFFDSTWDTFIKRVGSYVNWQFPGLEIRPAHGHLTKHLVGCDPLYLVDTSEELLEPSKSLFSPQYNQRLRHYVVNEDDTPILRELPHKQFGLVVAADFFQYRSIEMLERYAKEVFDLLRPGGHFVFAYNNCDLPNCVDLADNMFYCYTPGRKVRALLEQTGYEISASIDYNLNISWIEAKKPGTLSSIRGSQTLGKIVNI